MKEISIKCQGAITLELEQLVPFQSNLKNLSRENYKKLRQSILDLGFSAPCFVWKSPDGEWKVIDSHQRIRVLTEMKRAEGFHIPPLPCAIVEASTEQEAKKKILAITSSYGTVTDEGLFEFLSLNNIKLEHLDSLNFHEIDMDSFKQNFFDAPVEGQTEDDEVPEVSEPKVKIGDLIILGEHRLLCGDSTKVEKVESLMGGEKADMVFTDPPYGIGIDGQKESKNINPKHNRKAHEFRGWDNERPGDDIFKYIVSLNIPSVIFGGNYFADLLPASRGWIYWSKGQDGLTMSDGELAWTNLNKPLRSVVVNRASIGQSVHPTQKPIPVIEFCFKYIGEAPKVLDLFGGSGSTLIACEKTKRKCFMAELDPHYCSIIVERWQNYTGKTAYLIQDKTGTLKEPVPYAELKSR